jgi:hypothetical protein
MKGAMQCAVLCVCQVQPAGDVLVLRPGEQGGGGGWHDTPGQHLLSRQVATAICGCLLMLYVTCPPCLPCAAGACQRAPPGPRGPGG